MTHTTPRIRLVRQPLTYVIIVDSEHGPAQTFLPVSINEEYAHWHAKRDYMDAYEVGYNVRWAELLIVGSYGPFIPVDLINE
jgi:hypothetical protein